MVFQVFAVVMCICHLAVMSSTAYTPLYPTLFKSLLSGISNTDSSSYQGQGYVSPISSIYYSNQEHPVNGGQKCYKIPAYIPFNISDQSYYYPRDSINTELTARTDVLELLFKDGVKATNPKTEQYTLYSLTEEDKQSSVGDGVKKGRENEGCAAYKLLLQSFDHHGGHCWVVNPRHQDVTYVSCGAPKCYGSGGKGEYSACAEVERTVSVWAWCETLPMLGRITKIYLPLPISCKCQVYNC
ncbi:uncharacterized protein [Littorina saxatilis]